jgi:hypothetical protein
MGRVRDEGETEVAVNRSQHRLHLFCKSSQTAENQRHTDKNGFSGKEVESSGTCVRPTFLMACVQLRTFLMALM